MKKVMIVEDDDAIRELVSQVSLREGFEPKGIASGEIAVEEIRKFSPDLVILDIMLPGRDGLEICKECKLDDKLRDVPIMMLTTKGEESDIVTGLELGACDYITKPFSPKILAARMKAAMRKTSPDPSPTELPVKIHSISIDPKKFEVEIKGKKTDLTATEFRLLYLLAKNPGRVFTRSQIVSSVHGDDYPATDRSVDVQVVGLRKKLGDRAGRFIETVRGVGYRMREDK